MSDVIVLGCIMLLRRRKTGQSGLEVKKALEKLVGAAACVDLVSIAAENIQVSTFNPMPSHFASWHLSSLRPS
ncbi:hypothetical protein [Paracoccus niistensis]|uniref:Uncharacterized protein n=1 Tax=Paracoccus niistensis TaxID=632935 RepID=A0ABV6I843_9RHOB